MLTLEEVLSDAADCLNVQDPIEVNSRGDGGETPLHWMATLGDAIGIKLLLENGADINAVDNDGNSALHKAVSNRQTDAARLLIEMGSDTSQENVSGLTPKAAALQDCFVPTQELFI